MSDHWWLHSAELRSYEYENGNGGDGDGDGGEDEGFELECRTHDHRTLIISGHRSLFTDPTRMATEGEIRQLGEHVIRALNTATGELEGRAQADGV